MIYFTGSRYSSRFVFGRSVQRVGSFCTGLVSCRGGGTIPTAMLGTVAARPTVVLALAGTIGVAAVSVGVDALAAASA